MQYSLVERAECRFPEMPGTETLQEPIARMKILITGERGMLGRTLKETLAKHHAIVGLESWDGGHVDRILHCLVRHPYHSPEQIIESNINFLPTLRDLYCQSQAKDVIYFSSIVVYGNRASGCQEEESLIAPGDLYALSKSFGEEYLRAHEIPGITLRIPAIIEPNSRRNLISRIISDIAEDRSLLLQHLDKPFNALIAGECIAAFLDQLPILQGSRQTYNLMASPECTLEEICRYVANRFRRPLRLVSERETSPHRYFSVRRLRTFLGFQTGDARVQLELSHALPRESTRE